MKPNNHHQSEQWVIKMDKNNDDRVDHLAIGCNVATDIYWERLREERVGTGSLLHGD